MSSADPVQLRRPPFWSLIPVAMMALLATLLGAAAVIGIVMQRWVVAQSARDVLFFACIGSAWAIGLWVHSKLRPQCGPTIRCGETSVELPRSWFSRRRMSVPYDDILSVERVGKKERAGLVIGFAKRSFLGFPPKAFEMPGDADRLERQLLEQIAELPGAEARARAFAERARAAEIALTGGLWVTLILMGVLVLAFANETMGQGPASLWETIERSYGIMGITGAANRTFELLRLGGNASVLVADGEWFRLATANLLHLNPIHLYLNIVLLFALGMFLERLLGITKYLLILSVSALVGSAASSLVAVASISVGCSTALFGLLGAMLVLNVRFRKQLPGALRIRARIALVLVLLEVAIEMNLPAIDYPAHLGGLAAGVVATMFALRGSSLLNAISRTSRAVTVAAWLACGVFSLGLVRGAVYASTVDTNTVLDAVDRMLQSPRSTTFAVNNLAWALATHPDPGAARIAHASAAMERIVQARNPNSALLDTLATLRYRAGALDESIELATHAFRISRVRVHASQLARFEAARLARDSTISSSASAGLLPTVRLSPADAPDSGGRVLEVDLGRPYPQGVSVHALPVDGGRTLGHFALAVGTGGERRYRLTSETNAFGFLPDEVEFRIVMVHEGLPQVSEVVEKPPGPGSHRWWIFPMDEEVAALP